MAKKKKEEVKIPDLDKDPIYVEKTYSRQQGSIIEFTNIDDPSDIILSGRAVLQANTPQGLMPMPYNFEFPKSIKDYREGFARFREVITESIQKEQAKQTIIQPPPGSNVKNIANFIKKPGDNHR